MILVAVSGVVISLIGAWLFHSHLHSGGHLGEWPGKSASVRLGSGQMFDAIAKAYDSANMVMSLGLHHMWKDVLVAKMDVQPGDRVVDLATGTADVAVKLATVMTTEHPSAPTRQPGEAPPSTVMGSVLGLDPSIRMLDVARDKILARGLHNVVTLMQADGEDLVDLPDNQFDKLTISFGIRNYANRQRGLEEARRVMKTDSPGSRIGVLEFVKPQQGPLASLATLFLSYIIPALGALISGGRLLEYTHLRDSILDFPNPPAFAAMMTEAGFSNCQHENIFMHTVYVWTCDALSAQPPVETEEPEARVSEQAR